MISQDGEVVEFTPPLKLGQQKGVEGWLKEIRDRMIETVKKRIREALKEEKETSARQEWLLKHIGQAIAVVSMISWTT